MRSRIRSSHFAMVAFVIVLVVCSACTLAGAEPGASQWISKAPLNVARSSFSAVSADGRIFAIGGNVDGKFTGVVEAYDPLVDKWEPRTGMPTPRNMAGAVGVGGKVYVIGGFGLGPDGKEISLGTVEAYDPATDSWTRVDDMPTPRGNLAVTAVGTRIYAIGGWAVSFSNKVEVFDTKTGKWSTGKPMPTARDGLAVAAVDGRLYAIGGLAFVKKRPVNSGVIEVYDPVSDAWGTVAEKCPPTEGYRAVSVGDRILLTGGFSSQGALSVYVPAQGAWGTAAVSPDGKFSPR